MKERSPKISRSLMLILSLCVVGRNTWARRRRAPALAP